MDVDCQFGQQNGVEVDFKSDFHIAPYRLTPPLSPSGTTGSPEQCGKAQRGRKFDAQLKETPHEIHLTVRDSGLGFNFETARASKGLGLNHMKERLKLVKGSLSIDSQPKRGTAIRARVPLSLETDPKHEDGRNWLNISISLIDPRQRVSPKGDWCSIPHVHQYQIA